MKDKNHNIKRYFFLVLAGVCLSIINFSGCKKSTSSGTYSPNCSGTYSFKTDVNTLIQNNCVSCHSEYSNYSGISSAKTSIRSQIAKGSMPKNATLTSSQKDIIMCWIDSGANNN